MTGAHTEDQLTTNAGMQAGDAASTLLRHAVLEPQELLVLQLTARGYSRGQLAYLLGQPELMVDLLLRQAAAGIGVNDAHEAVTEAMRLQLIV